jgi:hypothetical protein
MPVRSAFHTEVHHRLNRRTLNNYNRLTLPHLSIIFPANFQNWKDHGAFETAFA